MAYSLNDVYQSLRTAMRLNGITVGVGLGGLLLGVPATFMAVAPAAGAAVDVPLWPYRMAGAVLIALGLHLLFAAQERIVRASTMLAMLVGNGLLAVVLLIGFLQRELADLSSVAQVVLGAVFFLCVVSAGFALRYLREDYNMT
ncbi:MAG: hypothetical protein WDZ49_07990 [Litorilinea sp.]